jgi:site-specific recombinase XerC
LRISEVAGLLLSDLYLDEPYPRLVARGKGRRERSVYLSSQAEHALRAYLAERHDIPSNYVFLSYLGDGLSTIAIHKRLVRYRDGAGVHLTSHRLRHTFANDLIEANVPVTTVQKLLGHRRLETTQIYVLANDLQVQSDIYAASRKLETWCVPAT